MTINCFKKELLDSAKIMVVGCGTLGSEVLKNLALLGVGHIVIVDFDNVEPHNISKSVLFSEIKDSIGKPKVEIIRKALHKLNPNIDITEINGNISADVGLGLIRNMDVLIGCVDNRWARYCINRLSMRAGKPWIDGGISDLEGTVKLFEPDKNCYSCSLSNEDIEEMKNRFPCAGNIRRAIRIGSAPTTSLIASIIGAVQAQEAIKLIHDKKSDKSFFDTLSGKMFIYDGKHLNFTTVKFEAFDDDCSLHDLWKPVIKSTLTEKSSLKEVLSQTRMQLGAYSACLLLVNDCFVDYIYDKDTNEQFKVMLPGRKVEEFITASPVLNQKSVSSYYQNEIKKFHRDSPYLDLTLEEIGFPAHDILKMRCGIKGLYRERDYYIEMS